VPDFALATTPDALAEAELKLTSSMLDYARHAQSGRMHCRRSPPTFNIRSHPTDRRKLLTMSRPPRMPRRRWTAKSATKALSRIEAKLAALRGQGDGPVIRSLMGCAKFTPGARASSSLRSRWKMGAFRSCAPSSASPKRRRHHYDAKVTEACASSRPAPDSSTGVLDERTIKAIKQPEARPPIDTGSSTWSVGAGCAHLGAPSIGDAMSFSHPRLYAQVMQNGAQVWSTKVVTGQPGVHATPLLTETMKFITSIRPGTCAVDHLQTNTCRRCSRIRPCFSAWG